MKIKIYILLIICFISNSYGSLKYEILQYNYKDGKTLIELNYQIATNNLKFNAVNDSIISSVVNLQFQVFSTGINQIDENWTFDYTKNITDSSLIIFDKRYFILYPGQYDFTIQSNTLDNPKHSNSGSLIVKKFDKNKLLISDILLAHHLEVFDSTVHQLRFKKNNLYIIPNVEHTISGAYSDLKYYYEIYNIDTSESHKIKMNYEMLTGDNKVVFNFSKNKTISTNSIFDFGFFPIDSLENGIYKLKIEVSQKDIILSQQTTKFYILDPAKDFHITDKFVENITFERSPFSIMTEERIKYEYETMIALLSEFEIQKYELLTTLRARQRAIYEYWKERDTNPDTPVNELLTEYKSRIEYADKYFSRGNVMPGWKTERGRVLLKYGFPTNREMFRAKEGKRAAEEWQYDELFGGSYFFFVDRFGDNSFLMVHSTIPNELKNFNWFVEFNPAIDNDGSPKYNSNRNNNR